MYKKLLLLCFAMYFIAPTVHAQRSIMNYYSRYANASSHGKKLYQRQYLGYGTAAMPIDIKQHYTDIRTTYPDPDKIYTYNGGTADTYIHTKYKPTSSWNYTEGSFYPLFKVGKEGLFAIDASVSLSVLTYKIGKIDYSSTTGIEEDGISEQIMIPIGFVYKSGGEVNLNKKSKVMFTMGCGIAPNLAVSKIIAFGDPVLTTRKYAMIEMGVFAGLAWKVRAVVYSGASVLVDNRYADIFDATSGHSNGYGNLDIKVVGSTYYTVTLLVNPFSWDWKGKGNNYSKENLPKH